AKPAAASAFRAPLELALQCFERHARAATCKAPTREVVILNVLELTQDCLARVIALAAAGFPGEGVKPLFYLCRQTKGKHFEAPVCYTCIAMSACQSNGPGHWA